MLKEYVKTQLKQDSIQGNKNFKTYLLNIIHGTTTPEQLKRQKQINKIYTVYEESFKRWTIEKVQEYGFSITEFLDIYEEDLLLQNDKFKKNLVLQFYYHTASEILENVFYMEV